MPANMKKAGIKYKVGGSVMKKAQVGGEQKETLAEKNARVRKEMEAREKRISEKQKKDEQNSYSNARAKKVVGKLEYGGSIKAQKGKEVKPDYSNIKGTGWDYFKTPTAKDSVDYKKGFNKKVKGDDLKQFPSPSKAEVRGYNEATKRKLKTGGSIKTKKKK